VSPSSVTLAPYLCSANTLHAEFAIIYLGQSTNLLQNKSRVLQEIIHQSLNKIKKTCLNKHQNISYLKNQDPTK